MDEDNLLSLVLLVLSHRLLEDIHLIMKNIGRVHSSSCFKHFICMKIDNEGTVILLALLFAGVGYHLLVLVHLLLQALGIDDQRTGDLVVLYDGEEIGWRLEEVILLEEMKLVELHWVQTELNVRGWLQKERLVLLVGNQLDGDVIHFVQGFTTEFLDKEFGVRLDFAFSLQGPCIALGYEIGVAQIVVAVVHHIRFEAGIGHVLDVDRHEGEVSAELVAARTLLHLLHEGNLAVGSIILLYVHIHVVLVLVQDSLDTSAVLMQFGVGMLLRSLLGIHLGRNHLAHGIVVLLHHYHLVDRHRNLESVFILHQHDIFALEAGHLSAAHFTQESYFITFLHSYFIFYFYLIIYLALRINIFSLKAKYY